jgi:hypothetical protein
VLESDLRDLFERQAATRLRRAPISIPVARRIGRVRLLRRRAGAVGTPVLAAVAVVAVLLVGPFAAGPRQSATGSGSAPKSFNPLVPYARITWYPFKPVLEGASDWRTAVQLRASSTHNAEAAATEVVLYAAGWCTLHSTSLSCGSTKSLDRLEMTVSGQAPNVQGQPAYWAQYRGGNLLRLHALLGLRQVLAFQYALGGWAVVDSTGTQADLLRVAASMRYGQTSAIRWPFRLTGLPSALSDVLYASFIEPTPGTQSQTVDELLLGGPADRPGTGVRNALTVETSTQTVQGPRCRTAVQQNRVSKNGKNTKSSVNTKNSKPTSCPSQVINGYRAYLNSPPVAGKQTLFVPDADGLYLYEDTVGPDAPLTPADVLAHHLQLLGPDPADWTTAPVSP